MPRKAKAVVVVDDDPSVRDSLAWLLGSAGLEVRAFADAREFLDGFDPHTTDCLVLDVRLPEMSGLELQAEIIARRWLVPIIVITGHGDVEIAVAAMKAGAVDFIQKPFSDEQLLASIDRAITEHQARGRHGSLAKADLDRLNLLTARERQVLRLVVEGKQNKLIAMALDMSPRTVETHRRHIMRKIKVGSVAELVRLVLTAEAPRRPDSSSGETLEVDPSQPMERGTDDRPSGSFR